MSQVETFEIACDVDATRTRIALMGSDGTEILVVLRPGAPALSEADARRMVLQQVEQRLRVALLAVIAKNWPDSP